MDSSWGSVHGSEKMKDELEASGFVSMEVIYRQIRTLVVETSQSK
jgi:hypothetical protein